MQKDKPKALIVGTGLGGLSAAIRLLKEGYRVEMVEKYKQAGGRLNQIKKDGFSFDMAPTFFSMSYEFHDFIKECGIEPNIEFKELDPLYSVYFSHLKEPRIIYKNIEKLAEQFKDTEPLFSEKVHRYLDSAGQFYHDTEQLVIKKNFPNKLAYLLALTKVPMKHSPKLIRSFWDELSRYFVSEEVKQIFSLVAFFLGATPYNTPAVYTLLNYTELIHDGYWNIEGGMYKLVEELLKILAKEGVEIHYNTEIIGSESKGKKITGLIDKNGKRWEADLYVINSDAASFRGKILGRKLFSEKKLDKMKWTLAPLTIYLGIEGKLDDIYHHNYFLGNNFKEYASKIFLNQIGLEKPYYYVNVPTRHNPEMAPPGCESLFILVPVPDLRYKPDWTDKHVIVESIIKDLSERIGVDLKPRIKVQTILTPLDWERTFNLYKGSGLGLAHDLNQIGAFRPKNYDEKFRNLFYVGASTTPGTGLPMTLISSKLLIERIKEKNGFIHKKRV